MSRQNFSGKRNSPLQSGHAIVTRIVRDRRAAGEKAVPAIEAAARLCGSSVRAARSLLYLNEPIAPRIDLPRLQAGLIAHLRAEAVRLDVRRAALAAELKHAETDGESAWSGYGSSAPRPSC